MTNKATEKKHETTYTSDLTPCFRPSYGNEKTGGKKDGVMAIGYMPGSGYLRFKDGTFVTDCEGTCGAVDCSACVKQCYAVSMVKRYKDARKARVQNTMHLRTDINAHFEAIRKTILKDNIKIVRYTDSGEIETYLQFLKLVNLALSLPSTQFYLYTKNYNVLREFFAEGKKIPSNMVVLVSIWEDLGKKEYMEFKHHNGIKAFAVNSDLKVACYCPAYRKDKNGKVIRDNEMTCAKCKLCFDSTAKIIGCYEH